MDTRGPQSPPSVHLPSVTVSSHNRSSSNHHNRQNSFDSPPPPSVKSTPNKHRQPLTEHKQPQPQQLTQQLTPQPPQPPKQPQQKQPPKPLPNPLPQLPAVKITRTQTPLKPPPPQSQRSMSVHSENQPPNTKSNSLAPPSPARNGVTNARRKSANTAPPPPALSAAPLTPNGKTSPVAVTVTGPADAAANSSNDQRDMSSLLLRDVIASPSSFVAAAAEADAASHRPHHSRYNSAEESAHARWVMAASAAVKAIGAPANANGQSAASSVAASPAPAPYRPSLWRTPSI